MERTEDVKGYLYRALTAEEQAGRCTSLEGKAVWLDVAKQYRLLATFMERRHHT